MDKTDLISEKRSDVRDRAVDGLIYGLVSGVAMYFGMAILALLSGDSPGRLLERFSAGGLTSPLQGLVSHLAVAAIYGMLFGALVWPFLRRLPPGEGTPWLGGLAFAACLLLLAQVAILPGTHSPLAQLPFWQWALGHGVYGLVLGGLFARRGA